MFAMQLKCRFHAFTFMCFLFIKVWKQIYVVEYFLFMLRIDTLYIFIVKLLT